MSAHTRLVRLFGCNLAQGGLDIPRVARGDDVGRRRRLRAGEQTCHLGECAVDDITGSDANMCNRGVCGAQFICIRLGRREGGRSAFPCNDDFLGKPVFFAHRGFVGGRGTAWVVRLQHTRVPPLLVHTNRDISVSNPSRVNREVVLPRGTDGGVVYVVPSFHGVDIRPRLQFIPRLRVGNRRAG
tara:strand:+ start:643 stop:1197 length:555 start_codon:yes stop_codon:yes gene_type:complete